MASSPPFAVIADDDKRGVLWIAAILSFIFVLLTLGARVYVRKHMLGWDDYASIAAVFLGIAQYAVVFGGMALGLGTARPEIRDGNELKIGKIFHASASLFLCAIYMAKLGVLATIERLIGRSMPIVHNICRLLRVVLAVAALSSLLAISLSCDWSTLFGLEIQKHCDGQVARWLAVSLTDAITELAVLGVFCFILWTLQMRRTTKMTLISLLCFKFISPVFTGVYTYKTALFANSLIPQVRVISPLVWQQIALGYSLIATLVIALMPFLKSFHTGLGVNVRNLGSITESSGRRSAYPLKNLSKQYGSSKKSGRSKHSSPRVSSSMVAEDEQALSSTIWTGPHSNHISSRSRIEARRDSMEISIAEPGVIQKTLDWSVQHEGPNK